MRTGKPKEWDEEEKALPPLLPEVSMKIVKAWVHTQGTKKRTLRLGDGEMRKIIKTIIVSFTWYLGNYNLFRQNNFHFQVGWQQWWQSKRAASVFNSLLLKTWFWWSTGLRHQSHSLSKAAFSRSIKML